MKTVIIMTALIFVGCAHKPQGPIVYVKSVGYPAGRDGLYTFANFQLEGEPIERFFLRKKVVDACVEIGKINNFYVESMDKADYADRKESQYLVVAELYRKTDQIQTIHPGYSSGSTTTCNGNSYGIYGASATCNSSGGYSTPAWTSTHDEHFKTLKLNIYSREDFMKKKDKAQPIRSVMAGMNSLNSDFTDTTANSLCRALYTNFPNDTDQQYEVREPTQKSEPAHQKSIYDKIRESMGLAGN